jgi:hypothetical protein
VDWHVHAKACLALLWTNLAAGSKLSGGGTGLTDTIRMLKDAGYGSSSRSLYVLLSALKAQRHSKAYDKVYGVMGMAELHVPRDGDVSLELDYTIPVQQLAIQLTLSCLQTE